MPSVYKRTDRKPIPENAVVSRAVKPLPSNARVFDGVAEWTDRTGCSRSAQVDGRRIVVQTAKWTGADGRDHTAPLDHTGRYILQVSRTYQAAYVDRRGKRKRRSTGTSDKMSAMEIARTWEAEAQREREGTQDRAEKARRQAANKPLSDHLTAYLDFRATSNTTENHRERTRRDVLEFAEFGKWETIVDIDPDDVTAWVAHLRRLGRSSSTIQSRIQSVKGFTRWLANHHRLRFDPLSMVRKPNPDADRKYHRRALWPDEWSWIAKAVQSTRKPVQGMKSRDRLLLYRLAIQTGLRASELFSLTPGAFVLDAETPYVLCKASNTKARRQAQQFISAELAADLEKYLRRKPRKKPVFVCWDVTHITKAIRTDLARARELWLESLPEGDRPRASASDFLRETNGAGERLSFHSLRHTCGTWLAMSGENVKIIQTVMRHSTVTLTIERYGHLLPGQTEEAAGKLGKMLRFD